MHNVEENLVVAQDAGYNVLSTHTLPRKAWVEGYYDILEPRAKELLIIPTNQSEILRLKQ